METAEDFVSVEPARAPVVRPVPAVTRAAAILRLLSRSDTPLHARSIAGELRLVPSTCLHILRALVAEELVAVDEDTKRYRLGTGLLSLSRKLLKQSGFANAVQDVLEDLSARHGVTAIGLEARGLGHVIVIAISHAHEPFHIHVDAGSRFPALISATGRCIAAFGGHSEREIERRFKSLRWDRPPSYAEWRQEVEAVKQTRFGVDADRYIFGVTIISAPVLRGTRVSNLIVAAGLSERLRGRVQDIGSELVEQAEILARRMTE
jgi:DNA-binding IclR family transcriptional regulator